MRSWLAYSQNTGRCILAQAWRIGPQSAELSPSASRKVGDASVAETLTVAPPQQARQTKNWVMATSVIAAHGLEHMYGRGFLFLLVTRIYVVLGLSDFQVGLIDGARQLYSGVVSMSSGFAVDMFQERRGQILAFSMALIGVGYFLVALAPSFGLMLAALALASAGTALWHPPALGLLAQRFPRHRGFFMSVHRSTGNIGDWVGPLVVGALLAGSLLIWKWNPFGWEWTPLNWRWILGGGTPLLLFLALLILVLLWNAGDSVSQSALQRGRFKAQIESLKGAMEAGGFQAILPIFLVSALRGMGDRPLVWMIPLYLSQELGKSELNVAFHLALLAAPGIISGPLFGLLSDRIGRKSIIAITMAAGVILPITMLSGSGGITMTLSVALFGLFMFSVNSLTQAAAIDLVEGRQLEGTFIGLMWGSNAFFGFGANLAAGALAVTVGRESVFYFASGLFFLGLIAALVMPSTRSAQMRAA